MPCFTRAVHFCFSAAVLSSVVGYSPLLAAAAPTSPTDQVDTSSLSARSGDSGPLALLDSLPLLSNVAGNGLVGSGAAAADPPAPIGGALQGVPALSSGQDLSKGMTRRASRYMHKGKSFWARSSHDAQYYDSHIQSYYSQLKQRSQALSTLAQQSYTVSPNDKAYQQNVHSQLTSFHDSLQGLESLLKQLGREKGLANYDRSNSLETVLKDIVNLNKDTLSAVTLIVYNIPVLGPVLGPIVYEIKCILDDVLNALENLVDGVLNVLKPLLQPIIGNWFTVACRTGHGLNLSGCHL